MKELLCGGATAVAKRRVQDNTGFVRDYRGRARYHSHGTATRTCVPLPDPQAMEVNGVRAIDDLRHRDFKSPIELGIGGSA
jgi:hypothetical protein